MRGGVLPRVGIARWWVERGGRSHQRRRMWQSMSCFRMLPERIPNPKSGQADAGYDAVMGFFVDVMHGDHVLRPYDSFIHRSTAGGRLLRCDPNERGVLHGR
jgi:hypothetical protein